MAQLSSILALSREQCRNHLTSTQNQTFDKIVVGAAIIRYTPTPDSKSEEPQILLLKRSPHEIYHPSVFEIPGGNVQSDNANIRAALCREVKEETGLDVTNVLRRLPDMTYFTEKVVRKERGREEVVRKSCIQLNFVVEDDFDDKDGEGGEVEVEVRVNPDEHEVGVWADWEMVEGLEMTDEMRGLVRSALEWCRVGGGGGGGDGNR